MFRLNVSVLALIAAGAVGCSGGTTVKEAPVSVSGKVSRGGKPVGDVAVWFQPLDSGHLQSLPVTNTGTFQGELVSGNYAYYVGRTPTASSAAVLKKIDAKYHEPDLRRSVSVEFGKELMLSLD